MASLHKYFISLHPRTAIHIQRDVLKIKTILVFSPYGRVLKSFYNVDGLLTSVEKVSTIWTGCGRASGRFPQCGRVADERRKGFHNVEAEKMNKSLK
ncbi:MAG: hypothetical protein LBF59_04305 [Prevotellaceae bacterium]|nr:hypothetical protein [Prevotellaceae bacterium]